MKKIILIGLLVASLAGIVSAANPVASNVTVMGAALYNGSATAVGSYTTGTLLTGSYDYSDADGDAEGATTYQWYRDGVAIGGATNIRYTITNADVSHTLTFGVTPKSVVPETGTEVISSSGVSGSVTTYNNAGTNNLTYTSGSTNLLNVVLANGKTITVDGASTVVTIWGDLDGSNGINVVVTNGGTLIVKGQFITNNNVDVTVDATSTFSVESGIDAKNGSNLTISGVLNVTGDITVSNNATFIVNDGGSLSVSGDLNFSNGGTNTFTVDGTVDIGGNLTGSASVLGTGTVTVAGTSSITDSQINALPIHLASFDVLRYQNNVKLVWATASEENNDYFTIERSTDGNSFSAIGTVLGAGNSSTTLNYLFIDQHPVNTLAYYRLKQTDYDGAYTYSDVKSVRVSTTMIEDIKVGPNPTRGELNIQLPVDVESGTLRIVSVTGSVLKKVEIDNSSMSLDLSDLPTGTYLVIVSTGTQFISKKIQKL